MDGLENPTENFANICGWLVGHGFSDAEIQAGARRQHLPGSAGDLDLAVDTELLAAYERLERLGRPLNAVASVIAAPRRAADGPLAGQPVAVKDIIAVAGVPTRLRQSGQRPGPRRRGRDLVSRLRAAGAEVFATTQCLEYAAGFAHPRDRRHPQPARPVPDLRRLLGRLGRAGRGRRLRPRPGHRHRRVDPDPGRVLRGGRAQAQLRGAAGGRGLPALALLRPRRHADRHRGRGRPPARPCWQARTRPPATAPAGSRAGVRCGGPVRAAMSGSPSACWPRQLADPSVTPEVRAAVGERARPAARRLAGRSAS